MESHEQHIDYELLITRYLSGEITEKEHQQLHHWISQDQGNRELLRQYEKTWHIADYPDTKSRIDLEAEWNKFEQMRNVRANQSLRTRFMHPTFLKIAAVFIAGLLVASTVLYFYARPAQYITTHSTKTIQLSDGSTVVLNKHSELQVQSFKNQNSRELSLKGEAFFEVRHDAGKPFKVKTDHLSVTVLGTSFNVKEYEDTQHPYVVVNNGKVAVDHQSHSLELKEGEKAKLDLQNKHLIKETNIDVNYLSWKTHIFEFNNDPLSKVVNTLNTVYDETIILKNDDLNDCRITTRFEKQSMESILAVLSSLLNVDIQKQDNTIEISGQGC